MVAQMQGASQIMITERGVLKGEQGHNKSMQNIFYLTRENNLNNRME